MNIQSRSTVTTSSSGAPLMGSALAEGRYRVGATLLMSTGGVCPQQVTELSLDSTWNSATGGFAGAEAGRPTPVRPNSKSSKPRYGSLASDGSG
ncbi:hypothetical protein [Kineosporia babensis]|uniref:Uncharacterized protein n=1 Tax=Kineosporia babensis TaxID=499548 RepID=A0A9X1NGU7_9ACTN|nr:hypothetical protein [Kineosporia babensis]MCD5313635.1 hypothetical protein [Kineosporia babensis]